MKSAKLILATLLLSQPMAVLAGDGPLAPSGAWTITREGEECRAVRSFGEGSDRVDIRLSQAAPGPGFALYVVDPAAIELRRAVAAKVRIQRGLNPMFDGPEITLAMPGTSWTYTAPAQIAQDAENKRPALASHLSVIPDGERKPVKDAVVSPPFRLAEQIKLVRSATALTIAYPKHTTTLTQPQLPAMLSIMGDCTAALVRSWGLDPQEQATLTRPKPIEPASWISPSDYPIGALMKGSMATLGVRFIVDAAGRARSCSVTYSTIGPDFTSITCDIMMKKARFSPATNPAGEPRVSYFATEVRFQIPSI